MSDAVDWARSFRNDRTTVEAFNFIDGDLIETFLELPREKQDEVIITLYTISTCFILVWKWASVRLYVSTRILYTKRTTQVVKGLLISVEDLVKKIETLAQALH